MHALDAPLDALDAIFMPYGPEDSGTRIVATFGAYELEYAALQRGVGLLVQPQRGLLRCTGSDRLAFLHRMATQDLLAMQGGQSRHTFFLNDKGRILADCLVHHGDLDSWIELDRVDVPVLQAELERRIIMDDVQLEDISDSRVSLALIGPQAPALLEKVSVATSTIGVPPVGVHTVLALGNTRVTAHRLDRTGMPGLTLWIPQADAGIVYQTLLDAAGFEPHIPADAPAAAEQAARRRTTLRGRPVGWLAFNTARIEAGWPIFHIDFGPDSLVHETGLVAQTVSFTKGCYLGQEIVARMQNLGHPKQVLVRLHIEDDRMPVSGEAVWPANTPITQAASQPTPPSTGAGDSPPVAAPVRPLGTVTSATISPLRGNTALALAMVKWGSHHAGTAVQVEAEGQRVPAVVQPLCPPG